MSSKVKRLTQKKRDKTTGIDIPRKSFTNTNNGHSNWVWLLREIHGPLGCVFCGKSPHAWEHALSSSEIQDQTHLFDLIEVTRLHYQVWRGHVPVFDIHLVGRTSIWMPETPLVEGFQRFTKTFVWEN